MAFVSNSTPLIYLAALADFDLLRALFDRILIPPAVYEEVVVNGAGYPVGSAVRQALDNWIMVQPLGDANLRDE